MKEKLNVFCTLKILSVFFKLLYRLLRELVNNMQHLKTLIKKTGFQLFIPMIDTAVPTKMHVHINLIYIKIV